MSSYALPAVAAVFTWWALTGLILFLDGRSPRTFPLSMAAATLALCAALWGLDATAGDTSVRGAYLAFLAALGVWGWIELSFLTGFITGPRRRACPAGCAGPAHFRHAVAAILYHEFAIILGAAFVLALTWHAANPYGAWTFLLLWAMRTSAKLNLFMGVPNLGGQYLPAHLKYLQSYFRKASMNLLFPVVVTAGTIVAVTLGRRALAADGDPFNATGYALLTTLLALAVLEHWFLVLPMPSEALWRFGLNDADATVPPQRMAPEPYMLFDFAPPEHERADSEVAERRATRRALRVAGGHEDGVPVDWNTTGRAGALGDGR
jgi:putative photosynthetic complex assembly protein 2